MSEQRPCVHCWKRPARYEWGDAFAWTHGWAEPRCGVCVYGPQLRHALSRTYRIPLLLARLISSWVRGV